MQSNPLDSAQLEKPPRQRAPQVADFGIDATISHSEKPPGLFDEGLADDHEKSTRIPRMPRICRLPDRTLTSSRPAASHAVHGDDKGGTSATSVQPTAPTANGAGLTVNKVERRIRSNRRPA